MLKKGITGIFITALCCCSSVMMAQKEANTREYQYVLVEAVKQKNLGQYAEAIKLYKLILKEKPGCAVCYYELGSIYLVTRQVSMAEVNLRNAYNLDPSNTWYTMAYLNALGAMENYDTIIALLKEKIKEDPGNTEWSYQRALALFSKGKTGKAIRILNGIEKEHGFSEKVTLLKASIYEKKGDYTKAREEIDKVMVLFPEAIQFKVVAAELCMKNGLEEEAASYYLDILESDSLNVFALTNLTDYYRKEGDMPSSLRYLALSFRSPYVEQERKTAILSFYLSDTSLINNYTDELNTVCEAYFDTYPEEFRTRLLGVDYYIQTGQYAHAFRHMKVYLEQEVASFPVYMHTLILTTTIPDFEETLEIASMAQSHYPDSADIVFFKGVAFLQLEKYDSAIVELESIDMLRFSSPDYTLQSYNILAEAYYRTGAFFKSDSIFELLIAENPDDDMILNNYSYYLAERGEKLDRAEELSEKVIQRNPEEATFLDTYAWVLYKMGSYPEALNYIEKAIKYGGEKDPEVNEHAGDIELALNNRDIAHSYYLKAIVLGGDRDRLDLKMNQIKESENVLDKQH